MLQEAPLPTTQSWSFASDCVPKLELGNEKRPYNFYLLSPNMALSGYAIRPLTRPTFTFTYRKVNLYCGVCLP